MAHQLSTRLIQYNHAMQEPDKTYWINLGQALMIAFGIPLLVLVAFQLGLLEKTASELLEPALGWFMIATLILCHKIAIWFYDSAKKQQQKTLHPTKV